MERNCKNICLSNSILTTPTAITDDNVSITNHSEITNAFNDYSAKVAVDIQSSIRFPNESILITSTLKYLIVFISAIDSAEVSSITFSLKLDKSDRPNSISTGIIK